MSRRWNSGVKITIGIFIIAITLCIFLPFLIRLYATKILDQIPGYHASIDGASINFFTASYQLKGLKLIKTHSENKTPFAEIEKVIFSIDYNSLLHGEFLGHISFVGPTLNFGAKKKPFYTKTEFGVDVDWIYHINKLMLLKINRLTVSDGTIAFYDFSSPDKIAVFLKNIKLDAQYLNTLRGKQVLLPSTISLQATSPGSGKLSMQMNINTLKPIPDLNMGLRFENIDLHPIRKTFETFTTVNIENGNLNLFSEISVFNGGVTGYVSSHVKNASINYPEGRPYTKTFNFIEGNDLSSRNVKIKNLEKRRIPLKGKVSRVQARFWPSLWNIFRTAFVEGFEMNSSLHN